MFLLTASLNSYLKKILKIYLETKILNFTFYQICFVNMINIVKYYKKQHKITLIIILCNLFKKIRKILIILLNS
jgi:hypothetical protein